MIAHPERVAASLGTIAGMREPRTLASLEALETEASAFVRSLRPKEDRATLVTLSGDLGAGKTSFTQAAAKALGVTDPVTSPTFVLAKSYQLPNGEAFRKLVHIDAYRLTEGKDLAPLAFEEAMQDKDALVMLEWPEMVVDGLPPADVAIALEALADDARAISYA
jgi:tRNA threonylcarbamoyladenosine biosynthesis protein TsaE